MLQHISWSAYLVFIFISTIIYYAYILIENILYCEAMKNYTKVILKNGQRLMPLISLSKFETLLYEAGAQLLQVHRSFLIAKKHITTITPNVVTVDKYEIPIGIQFKERFFKTIGMRENG